jgi:hypothetical protein
MNGEKETIWKEIVVDYVKELASKDEGKQYKI